MDCPWIVTYNFRELAASLLSAGGSFCNIQRKISSKPICSLIPPHLILQEIDYFKKLQK
jgi:hypothetical protein